MDVSREFRTTHWSVVLTAAAGTAPSSEAALERLCRTYWYPLYATVRRRGFDPHSAQDLTQAFFERLLEKNSLRSIHPGKGRFRSFLLACLNHFLSNEWRDARARKRGGHVSFVPFDHGLMEGRLPDDTPAGLSPEHAFDRTWALHVLEQAMRRMEADAQASGKEALFVALKPFLVTPVPDRGYDAVAHELDLTPHAVATAVMRLRRQFRKTVRDLVAETVSSPMELEEELRHLCATLNR